MCSHLPGQTTIIGSAQAVHQASQVGVQYVLQSGADSTTAGASDGGDCWYGHSQEVLKHVQWR